MHMQTTSDERWVEWTVTLPECNCFADDVGTVAE
jgi:hypothetical protein